MRDFQQEGIDRVNEALAADMHSEPAHCEPENVDLHQALIHMQRTTPNRSYLEYLVRHASERAVVAEERIARIEYERTSFSEECGRLRSEVNRLTSELEQANENLMDTRFTMATGCDPNNGQAIHHDGYDGPSGQYQDEDMPTDVDDKPHILPETQMPRLPFRLEIRCLENGIILEVNPA